MGHVKGYKTETYNLFQSTHPVWDGTIDDVLTVDGKSISIHPSRVGWDNAGGGMPALQGISIHPSRVGWDAYIGIARPALCISIHPSRVGWDAGTRAPQRYRANFNPPIPCGMGPALRRLLSTAAKISIHPSRVGWDNGSAFAGSVDHTFQSTHPVWDGTIRHRLRHS